MLCQIRFAHFSQRRIARTLFLLTMLTLDVACVHTPRAVVPLHIRRSPSSPRDADVIVDEEYVGPLFLVVTQGLRLPVGQHRVTITREGYFPWDRLVDADRAPIELAVELVPIPE